MERITHCLLFDYCEQCALWHKEPLRSLTNRPLNLEIQEIQNVIFYQQPLKLLGDFEKQQVAYIAGNTVDNAQMLLLNLMHIH